jgi:hypothetical protein
MLSRRALLAASAATLLMPTFGNIVSRNFGYLPQPELSRCFANKYGYFAQHSRQVEGTSEGKVHSLIPTFEKITGVKFVNESQGSVGTCGGVSGTTAVDLLCADGVARGRGDWRGKFSSEVTYAGSRVEVGKGWLDIAQYPKRFFHRRIEEFDHDGTFASWVMEWLMNWGVVLRGKYGEHDLTKYDGMLARNWGTIGRGVPDELEPIAKKLPVKKAVYIKSFEEICDCIYNGRPVIAFSERGFQSKSDRDKYGFLDPVEEWAHVMVFSGFDRRRNKRPGCEVINPWGDWIHGPEHEIGSPQGTFWADKSAVDEMAKYECFAISDFEGFPRQKVIYNVG